MLGYPAQWGDWVYRALTFLVISCPCALVISHPADLLRAASAARAKSGVLDQGLATISEALSKAGAAVFDKTGTLTQGVFEVSGAPPPRDGVTEADLLEYAALAE